MAKALKNRASKQSYHSPQQLTLSGFESPFSQQLLSTNRWVVLAHSIPWDTLVNTYNRSLGNGLTGAAAINPRVAIGAVIIKHMLDISDRETILQLQENMYMQYFIGYSSFSNEAPFDASVFVDIRKRLSLELIGEINEKILGLVSSGENKEEPPSPPAKDDTAPSQSTPSEPVGEAVTHDESAADSEPAPKGSLLMDATACPQDIAYPTDLNLLSDAREKAEELIDVLQVGLTTPKPRTYREIARKKFLQTAQKKKKTKKGLRNAIRVQLQYLRRNIQSIQVMLARHGCIPLDEKQYKYLLVIQTLYGQQKEMYDKGVHRVEDRIVSLHQPHDAADGQGKDGCGGGVWRQDTCEFGGGDGFCG